MIKSRREFLANVVGAAALGVPEISDALVRPATPREIASIQAASQKQKPVLLPSQSAVLKLGDIIRLGIELSPGWRLDGVWFFRSIYQKPYRKDISIVMEIDSFGPLLQ